MAKIIYYAACTLDNFIAGENDELDWLLSHEGYGFHDFYNPIGTTIIGSNTYKMIQGFEGEFPYKDKKNYVISSKASLEADGNVEFIHENVSQKMRELKKSEKKDIWLVGGGLLASYFLENNLLDEIKLFVHPIYLGKGIPLFSSTVPTKLKNTHTKKYDNGVVQMEYEIIK